MLSNQLINILFGTSWAFLMREKGKGNICYDLPIVRRSVFLIFNLFHF